MDASTLAKLPGELRNSIYQVYFQQTDTIEIRVDGDRSLVIHHPLALRKTCRQIYRESTHVFQQCGPTACFSIRTEAFDQELPSNEPFDPLLVNTALALFSGETQACFYGVKRMAIHLGELDLISPKYSDEWPEIRCNGRDNSQVEGTRERMDRLLLLACHGCDVACDVVCDILLEPGLKTKGVLITRTADTSKRLCASQVFQQLNLLKLRMWRKGEIRDQDYGRWQYSFQMKRSACVELVKQLVDCRLSVCWNGFSTEAVCAYQHAIRQREDFTAASVFAQLKFLVQKTQPHCLSGDVYVRWLG